MLHAFVQLGYDFVCFCVCELKKENISNIIKGDEEVWGV